MSAVDEVMLKLPDETASQLDEFLTYAPRCQKMSVSGNIGRPL